MGARLSIPDLFGEQPATLPPDGEKGRVERGAFYTDDRLALAIARVLRDELGIVPSNVFEPGCGGGAFLRAAAATWASADLVGIDLVPACTGPGGVVTGDLFAIRRVMRPGAGFSLALGNPDFGIAERVVRHCLENVVTDGGHVAMLLRLSFWESADRVPLFRAYPVRAFASVAQRQSFTGDGGADKVGLGLYVWQRGFTGRGELLQPLVWR